MYISEDIPSKELENHIRNDWERIYIGLNLTENKSLLFGCYHPSSQSDEYFFYHLNNNLDKLLQNYENTYSSETSMHKIHKPPYQTSISNTI